MRKHTVFDSLNSLETLDLRLSPTSLSLGASLVPPAIGHLVSTADDPLPDPEPSPGPDTRDPLHGAPADGAGWTGHVLICGHTHAVSRVPGQ